MTFVRCKIESPAEPWPNCLPSSPTPECLSAPAEYIEHFTAGPLHYTVHTTQCPSPLPHTCCLYWSGAAPVPPAAPPPLPPPSPFTGETWALGDISSRVEDVTGGRCDWWTMRLVDNAIGGRCDCSASYTVYYVGAV